MPKELIHKGVFFPFRLCLLFLVIAHLSINNLLFLSVTEVWLWLIFNIIVNSLSLSLFFPPDHRLGGPGCFTQPTWGKVHAFYSLFKSEEDSGWGWLLLKSVYQVECNCRLAFIHLVEVCTYKHAAVEWCHFRHSEDFVWHVCETGLFLNG